MGKFRVVAAVLISERNHEVALAGQRALAKARRDLGFDPIYDLVVERLIVVRKIDIPLDQAGLCDQRQTKKQNEGFKGHADQIPRNGPNGKMLIRGWKSHAKPPRR